MRKLILASMALSLAAPVLAQSSIAGVNAWKRGDYTSAVAIWFPLAEQGDSDAAYNLSQAYRLGQGVTQNDSLAQGWLSRAASAGHLKAQASMGISLFQKGEKTAAAAWLEEAARYGEPRALLMLGTMTYNGDGITQDPIKAYALVSRAAAQGLPAAKETLAQLDGSLSADQRQQGLTMAQSMISATPLPAITAREPVRVARADPPAPKPVQAKAAPKPAPIRVARADVDDEPAPVRASGNWRIQVGAFSQRASASGLFGKLSGRLPGRQAYYIPVGAMTRLQIGPFESKAAATSACARIAPQACFAVPAK